MNMDASLPAWAVACRMLLTQASSVLLFRLTPGGIIEEANPAAESLVGLPLAGRAFAEVLVDFSGAFDLTEAAAPPPSRRLLSLSSRDGLPQSYFFLFLRHQEGVFALGELDSEEIQAMSRTVVDLNQELSNMTRRLHQQNAHLQRLNEEKQELIQKLQNALNDVKTLSGLVPICSHCKSIRDDQGFWSQVETFLNRHPNSDFSHGICPVCAERYYPDLDLYGED